MKFFIEYFDKPIFYFFQKFQTPAMDFVLGWPTHLGRLAVLLPAVILGILIFDRKGIRKLPAVLMGMLGNSLLTEQLKAFFLRPRPHLFWEDIRVIFTKPENHAFPSGHTSTVFAAAFILTHFYGKKLHWAYILAVWVAMTRLYVGAHYPTDLIGGALLGTGFAWLTCRLFSFSPKAPQSS